LKERVVAVCRGKEKGEPKQDVSSGFFGQNLGLLGDAHAGTEKQASILMKESADHLSVKTGLTLPAEAFAENLLIEGLDPSEVLPGQQLKIRPVILLVERIGKDPGISHSYHYHGHSLLPRFGVFARVIESGMVRNGDGIELPISPL
jgi:MOSC domain-containing protein YiiM